MFWICFFICLMSIFSFILEVVILVEMDFEVKVFDLWLNFCIMKLSLWLYELFFFSILCVFLIWELRWFSFLVIFDFCVSRISFCFMWFVLSLIFVFLNLLNRCLCCYFRIFGMCVCILIILVLIVCKCCLISVFMLLFLWLCVVINLFMFLLNVLSSVWFMVFIFCLGVFIMFGYCIIWNGLMWLSLLVMCMIWLVVLIICWVSFLLMVRWFCVVGFVLKCKWYLILLCDRCWWKCLCSSGFKLWNCLGRWKYVFK